MLIETREKIAMLESSTYHLFTKKEKSFYKWGLLQIALSYLTLSSIDEDMYPFNVIILNSGSPVVREKKELINSPKKVYL